MLALTARRFRSAKLGPLRTRHTLLDSKEDSVQNSSSYIDYGEHLDKKIRKINPCIPQHVKWAVNIDENGTRLDRFVKRHAPGLPPGLIQKLIRKGRITVDGVSPRRNAHLLVAHSVVTVPGDLKLGLTRGKRAPPPDDTTLAEASEIRKWIIHRDARCVVLNKPAGISTQGGGPSNERHVEAMLPGIGSGRYWLVHRLDKEVSGALVVARDIGAASLLSEHFRERKVSKTYWALVRGKPLTDSGVITAAVGGKPAFTRYNTMAREETLDLTLLELKPRTGRKHQLRVHCAGVLGTPIVGDLRYSPRTGLKSLLTDEVNYNGINLHASRLEFPTLTKVHPGGAKPQFVHGTRKVIDVQAPLPHQLRDYWQSLGLLSESKAY